MTASTTEREKAPVPLPTETPEAETKMSRNLLKDLQANFDAGSPVRLIGFDIHMRLCWRWRFAEIRIGRVWKIVGISTNKAIKHELAP